MCLERYSIANIHKEFVDVYVKAAFIVWPVGMCVSRNNGILSEKEDTNFNDRPCTGHHASGAQIIFRYSDDS